MSNQLAPVTDKVVSIRNATSTALFQTKWILLPFYFGLALAQFPFLFKFYDQLWDFATSFQMLTRNEVAVQMIELIDYVMIANLVKMIAVGSYQSFVEKRLDGSSEHISSGALKVKMGSSLVGITSVHLLTTFLNAKAIDSEVWLEVLIHCMFMLGVLVLAIVDWLHHKSLEGEEHK